MKKLNRNERGQAMIFVTVFFLVISLTIILGLAGPVSRGQASLSNFTESKQSYYIAEAGAEEAVLGQSPPSINDYSPSVSVSQAEAEKNITSTSDWDNSVHTIKVAISVSTTSPTILSWTESQ